MESLALATAVPTLAPNLNPHFVRDGRFLLVKLGEKDLGFCEPAIDGQGVSHGWNAYAYQPPRDGFGCATVSEHRRLKTAAAFIVTEGVAL